MKSLMLIVMIALPTTAFAVDNPEKYAAYKERRAARKAYALEQRRLINASRPPARGYLAIHRPDISFSRPRSARGSGRDITVSRDALR